MAKTGEKTLCAPTPVMNAIVRLNSKQYTYSQVKKKNKKKQHPINGACACVCTLLGLNVAQKDRNSIVVFVLFYVCVYYMNLCIVLKHKHLYVYGLCSMVFI